jgi:dinuclear metal center YbgI/SA1388 family protein
MLLTVQHVCEFLSEFAPPPLAEDWDNVGLLVGDASQPVRNLMTCLTVTPESVEEAVREGAELIVTHHPFPFRPLKQITSHSIVGRLLLRLISAGIAVHSPHTAFDSAAAGINQRLAEGLGLANIRPLQDSPLIPNAGTGRWGILAQPEAVATLAGRIREFLRIAGLQIVGRRDQVIRSVAVACGSAGQLLGEAREAGCDLFVTGETTFHTCLEAQASGIALILPGHFASERFAVEQLAEVLARKFPPLTVWSSRAERDPLEWLGQSVP